MDLLARTPGFQVPDIDSVCLVLKSGTAEEKRAALASLARSVDGLDDIVKLFGAEKLKGLNSEELRLLRQSLRSLQYLAFFKKYGKSEAGTYFFGASIMTIGMVNLHSSYVTSRGAAHSPLRRLHDRTQPGHFSDAVTFSPLSLGNQYIFHDLAPRTALAARCDQSNLGELDFLGVARETLGPKKIPVAKDPPRCRAVMDRMAAHQSKDWALEMVACEQDLAQESLYTFSRFPEFAFATRTTLSTATARTPIYVDAGADAPEKFDSLRDYWRGKRSKEDAVFANFDYRTPWLTEQLDQVREIVRHKDQFDLDRAVEDTATQAALYLAPFVGSPCDVKASNIVIHRREQAPAADEASQPAGTAL